MVLAFLKNYSSIYFFFWCNNLQRSNVPSGSGCRRPWDSEPGHSDFVLIRTGEVNAAASTSSSLKVCLFIDLFPNKVDTPGPPAYVEWFTPLHKPDGVSGYYYISR